MKKALLLIATTIMLSFLAEAHYFLRPYSEFEKLISENSSDQSLLNQLKDFKKGGIEKYLDIHHITPDQFIQQVQVYLGTPYKFGGTSKAGIDCSGLIMATFNKFDVHVPHVAQELARHGRVILDKNNLQKGDLIFFTKTYNTSKLITHAAFYIGEGKMVHASTSKGVVVSNVDDPYYWNKKYIFATRIFDKSLKPSNEDHLAGHDANETGSSEDFAALSANEAAMAKLSRENPVKFLSVKYSGNPSMTAKLNEFIGGGVQQKLDIKNVPVNKFIEMAKSYVGTPFVYGGLSHKGIDCSGLIKATFRDCGIEVAHLAEMLARYGQIIINKEDIKAGDVLFFINTYNTKHLITHAAFAISNTQMVNASSSKGVIVQNIDDPYYWNDKYFFATRVFPEERTIGGRQSAVVATPILPSEPDTTHDHHEGASKDANQKMASLILKYRSSPEMLHKIDNFIKDGFEKPLDTHHISEDIFITVAKSYEGTPYKKGGYDKKGMDDSGLLIATFEGLNVQLPHLPSELARQGNIIMEPKELKKGDLIFFTDTKDSDHLVTHVAFYLGNGKMIHSLPKKGVEIQEVNKKDWMENWLFATRIFHKER